MLPLYSLYITINTLLYYTILYYTEMIHQVEILENILHRLPAKSIGRFRCVSKPWRSLLSQPHFIKAHLNRTKQLSITEKSILLVSKEPHSEDDTNQNRLARSLYSIQLKSTSAPDETTTTAALSPSRLSIDDHRFTDRTVKDHVASCEGLVLIVTYVRGEGYIYEKLLLVNPTTRETKELPASPYALKPEGRIIRCGLGYDSFTDDYKVVSITFYGENYCYCQGQFLSEPDPDALVPKVCVYSVKNGTWKRVDNSPYDHLHSQSGVFVNGHIHWLAFETYFHPSYGRRWLIAAFDLKEEKLREVPLPNLDGYDAWGSSYDQLTMVEDCLCLLSSSSPMYDRDDDDDDEFDKLRIKYFITIFVMKQYNVEESWTEFTAADYEDPRIRPLCSLGKDQMVVILPGHSYEIQKKLVIYNSEGRSKDILIQGIPEEFHVIGTFIESLVSPHCICSDEAVNEE